MNLKKEHWTEKDYQEYIKYLQSIQEEDYRNFHQKLTPTKYPIFGIRVPIQRYIAKEISKGNKEEFLNLCKNNYYEEINIEGFVIANISDELALISYMDEFVLKIDNWAICDGFCNSVHIKNKELFFGVIQKYLKSEKEFIVRVGLVLLLVNYVTEEYIDVILDIAESLQREEYYINMALSWLLAECYIKFKEKTLPYLKKNHLSRFVQNKTISKICDSYRVSKEEKISLKTLRK